MGSVSDGGWAVGERYRNVFAVALGGRCHGSSGSVGTATLSVGLHSGKVVHGSEFDEGGEDKGEADGNEPVHGGGVGDFRQRVSSANTQSRHR